MTTWTYRRAVWLDIVLAVIIGVAAGTIAFRYVSAHLMPGGTDEQTFQVVSASVITDATDLLSRCITRGGVTPSPAALVRLPEWRAFITGVTPSFPCGALAGVEMIPLAYGFGLQRHLHRTMSWVLEVTGPRLIGIVYYQAVEYGVVLALMFGVFRLGMNRVISTVATIPMMASPRHLEMALAPIEYAKAPFFFACVLGVGLLVRARLSKPAAYLVALATGAVLGFGLGFKPDVLVFAPFGVMALALFGVPALEGGWHSRVPLIAVYLAAFVVTGAPLLRAHFFGPNRSLLPVQIMGGMTPSFTGRYAKPALYDYGLQFDDDYLIAAINSYNQRVNGSPEFGLFFTRVLQKGATDMAAKIWAAFPGDIVLRTYATILQILQFMPGGAVIALVVLIGVCYFDVRLAAFVAFTVAYMVGYVSLAFAPKHIFHLEFVPWWFAGCAVGFLSAAFGRARRPEPAPSPAGAHASWRTAAVWVAIAIVAVSATLVSAQAYQDHEVRSLVAGYLEPDRIEWLDVKSGALPMSAALAIPQGVPLDDHGAPHLGPNDAPIFESPDVKTDYIVMRARCLQARSTDVVIVYRRPAAWRSPFAVPCEAAGQEWTLLWPVYQHQPHQLFAGFEVADPRALQMVALGRMKDVREYPLLLRLRLPDDWSRRPLHQALDPAGVSPMRVRPLTPALTPPVPPLPPPDVPWDPPFVRDAKPLEQSAPALTTWSPSSGVSVVPHEAGVRVEGDSSPFGYQLVSPAIAVRRHARMAVRVLGAVEQGRAAFGVLDGAGAHWLLPAVLGRSDFTVNTGANDRVILVFANFRQPADGVVSTRFTVRSVSYETGSDVLHRVQDILWPVEQ